MAHVTQNTVQDTVRNQWGKPNSTLVPAAGKKHGLLNKDRARQEDIPAGPNVIRTITYTHRQILQHYTHKHAQKLNVYFSLFLLLYSGRSSDLTPHIPRWAKETNVMNHSNVGLCVLVNAVVFRAKGTSGLKVSHSQTFCHSQEVLSTFNKLILHSPQAEHRWMSGLYNPPVVLFVVPSSLSLCALDTFTSCLTCLHVHTLLTHRLTLHCLCLP